MQKLANSPSEFSFRMKKCLLKKKHKFIGGLQHTLDQNLSPGSVNKAYTGITKYSEPPFNQNSSNPQKPFTSKGKRWVLNAIRPPESILRGLSEEFTFQGSFGIPQKKKLTV